MSLREDPDCGQIISLPRYPAPFNPAPRRHDIGEDRPLHERLLLAGGTFSKARKRFLRTERVAFQVAVWLALGLVIGFTAGLLFAVHAGALH